MKTTLIAILVFACNCLLSQSVPYGYNEEAGSYFKIDNNTKLYYEIYGDGPALLMLHGGVFGYIDEFEYLIPELAKKYKVVCLATRGHVKSDIGVEPYSYEQRAKDAYRLIQHLDLNRVTVIGFSDGGFAAYKLAASYPNVVEKIVVMGAGNDPVKDRQPPLNYTSEALLSEYPDYFKKRLENMPEPNRFQESLTMMSKMYNQSVVSKETFSKIKCPVLVMSGDQDEYSSPTRMLEAHNYIDNSELSIIPGCDHVILYCNFPAVWESMKVFLGFKED